MNKAIEKDLSILRRNQGEPTILSYLTDRELQRLKDRIWEDMTAGDGYQAFGYDARTMRINHPIEWPLFCAINQEQRERAIRQLFQLEPREGAIA